MAFSHKYLLHGILSLTAMHRCHDADESQTPNLIALARYHQQHALSLYIPLLQRIDYDNCHPLFAFSIVLTLLSYGTLKSDEHSPQSLIHGFTDVCDSMCGAAAVAIQADEWLRSGPLGPVLTPYPKPLADLSGAIPNVRTVLEPLLQCADGICQEASAHQGPEEVASRHSAYQTAIMGVASCFAQSSKEDDPYELASVTSWPIMTMATSYLRLLKERDPLALVILGNYGAALSKAGSLWIIEGLGRRLTEAVVAEVDPAWHPLLAWARSCTSGAHTPVESTLDNNTRSDDFK